jgi:IclR family transcriptional regulator, pca regulon regulatory protein
MEGAAGPDKEFMATLAKGLAVIQAFGAERPRLTLSEAANARPVPGCCASRVADADAARIR